jgi:hypothetical protein
VEDSCPENSSVKGTGLKKRVLVIDIKFNSATETPAPQIILS